MTMVICKECKARNQHAGGRPPPLWRDQAQDAELHGSGRVRRPRDALEHVDAVATLRQAELRATAPPTSP